VASHKRRGPRRTKKAKTPRPLRKKQHKKRKRGERLNHTWSRRGKKKKKRKKKNRKTTPETENKRKKTVAGKKECLRAKNVGPITMGDKSFRSLTPTHTDNRLKQTVGTGSHCRRAPKHHDNRTNAKRLDKNPLGSINTEGTSQEHMDGASRRDTPQNGKKKPTRKRR